MSIKIGIIGVGMIANMHAEGILKIPEAEFTGFRIWTSGRWMRLKRNSR